MFHLFFLSIITSCIAFNSNTYYHAECNSKKECSLKEGNKGDSSHSYGMYNDEVTKDGWGKLWIHSDATEAGAYEAGFVEGALTSERIYQHFQSWYSYQFPSSAPILPETEAFINDQYAYAWDLVNSHEKQVENNENKDKSDYFKRLKLVLLQFEGIAAGMQQYATKDMMMSKFDLLLLEAAGDLYDIIPATKPALFKLQVGKLSKEAFEDEWHRMVSCSAMIKINDNNTDLFVGHTTWTSYVNMLRIYKNYNLFDGEIQVSFSAKPGVVYSKDDFYVLPNKKQQMVVLETTNGIMNGALYSLIKPQSLLTWQRMPLTNGMASSGKEWVDIFAKYNSGTYCNQYMVVDMKRFIPGAKSLSSDLVWIIEVIPGYVESQDITPVISSLGNVWPSYNVPYFKSVYIISGFQNAYETYGDTYSYDNTTRALMMRRDHVNIQTEGDMVKEMRKCDYKTDPYSAGDPGTCIPPRRDLRTEKGSAFGGIDAKITSFSRMKAAASKEASTGHTIAQSGPSHLTADLPPFQWSSSNYSAMVHLGQPDTFNFDFVDIKFYEN
jgi:hypothetical protein